MYEYRHYRDNLVQDESVKRYRIVQEESDIQVTSEKDYSDFLKEELLKIRKDIKRAIAINPDFLHSLTPIEDERLESIEVARLMIEASKKAQVGPFGAVAGAVNDLLAKAILDKRILILENGGDLYIAGNRDIRIGIYAGQSPLSNKFALELVKEDLPLGVCTSSATVGHAYSEGAADAGLVIGKSSALADAFATAFTNRIKKEEDIEEALNWVMGHEDIYGALAIMNDKIGAMGNIKLAEWK